MREEYKIYPCTRNNIKPFLIDIHYAKRIPVVMYAFGLYHKNELVGVITYGTPPSPTLCKGICGEEYTHHVLELNRLCLKYNRKNEASMLVMGSMKFLEKPKIIVSFADTEQSHEGYVYQATNFLYTGVTTKRKEWREVGKNTHSRSITKMHTLEERIADPERFYMKDRSSKHRYIYFLGDKRQKKEYLKNLKYPIQEYPKGYKKDISEECVCSKIPRENTTHTEGN